MRHHTVQAAEAGLRLDQYLARVKPDFTRSFIQKLIKGGSVFVNGKKTVKAAHKLAEGDELAVLIPSLKETGISAENIPLTVLYEDADMIVVNKPAGMVTHPTDHGAHVSGTLVNALLHHCKGLSGIGGEKRPGIVHRLDKDTSGIMVAAKNDAAHHALSRQFQDRTTQKRYIALLKGHLTPREGSIEAPLLKGHGEMDMRVSARRGAKYALTHYKVLEYPGDYSLTEVVIVTGRTHQIRAHFAAIGHPVCGDAMYGDPKVNAALYEKGLTRQFLHAASLKISHPATGKPMAFEAPLPEDLAAVLEKIA